MKFDIFISHATEDKDSIARPLAEHLKSMGYVVWFDEFELKLGDSLRQKIDKGLADSRFGILILSPDFFSKKWTTYELNSLSTLEVESGKIVMIPIWHNVNKKDVLQHSPYLADKIAAVSTLPLNDICQKISEIVGPATKEASLLKDILNLWDEETCPRCGQKGESYGFDGSDGDEAWWFECPHCGYFEGLN